MSAQKLTIVRGCYRRGKQRMGVWGTGSFSEGKRFQSQVIILAAWNFSNELIFINSNYGSEGYKLLSLPGCEFLRSGDSVMTIWLKESRQIQSRKQCASIARRLSGGGVVKQVQWDPSILSQRSQTYFPIWAFGASFPSCQSWYWYMRSLFHSPVPESSWLKQPSANEGKLDTLKSLESGARFSSSPLPGPAQHQPLVSHRHLYVVLAHARRNPKENSIYY